MKRKLMLINKMGFGKIFARRFRNFQHTYTTSSNMVFTCLSEILDGSSQAKEKVLLQGPNNYKSAITDQTVFP